MSGRGGLSVWDSSWKPGVRNASVTRSATLGRTEVTSGRGKDSKKEEKVLKKIGVNVDQPRCYARLFPCPAA